MTAPNNSRRIIIYYHSLNDDLTGANYTLIPLSRDVEPKINWNNPHTPKRCLPVFVRAFQRPTFKDASRRPNLPSFKMKHKERKRIRNLLRSQH